MYNLQGCFFSPPVRMVMGFLFINYCSYMSLFSTAASTDYTLVFSAIYWSSCKIAESFSSVDAFLCLVHSIGSDRNWFNNSATKATLEPHGFSMAH